MTPRKDSDSLWEQYYCQLVFGDTFSEENVRHNVHHPFWKYFSQFVPVGVIQRHPDLPWHYGSSGLSVNPTLTWEFISSYLDQPWNFTYLSKHSCITWDIVQQHPDLEWDYQSLSMNPNVTWEIIHAHPECPFHVGAFSSNANVTPSCVEDHPELAWNYCSLSSNPGIPCDYILTHPHYSWSYIELGAHPFLTVDLICSYPYKPWDLLTISENPTFSWEELLEMKHVFPTWNLMVHVSHYIRRNPNFTQREYSLYFQNVITLSEVEEFRLTNPMTPLDLQSDLNQVLVWLLTHSNENGQKHNFGHNKKQFDQQQTTFQRVLSDLHQRYFHPSRYHFFALHGHTE